MVNSASARYGVGIIGNIVSFGLFLSPIPTFRKIMTDKTVDGFQPYPYIATVMNCMMWVYYGMPFVHPDSILVITINGVGLIIELIYLGIYCRYASINRRKNVLLWIFTEVVFLIGVIALTLMFCHTHKKRSMIVGVLCVIFNIIMYISPLTIMAKVIQTDSVQYMPFWLSVANFCNGAIWTSYAVIHKFDRFIFISNAIGTVAGLCQISLYAYYKKNGAEAEPQPDFPLRDM